MFGGGGGGLDPRKMKQMMEQMGIDMEDIDAEEVIIRTPEKELYFTDAEVQLMEAQGQSTYQVVGEPEERALDAGGSAGVNDADATSPDDATGGGGIPEDDVELVAMRAGVDEATARDALEATDGDLAAAVERLE
jgi:nascent polypeptide-associated complex subunit alpha